jgi:hypothetical protein
MVPFIGLAAGLLFSSVSPLLAQGGNAATASDAVKEYIRAASDSNLSRMEELFGTDKGNSIHIHVADLQKRMVITQAYLARVSARIMGEVPGAKNHEKDVTTELSVGSCRVVTSVTAVQSAKDGWLVRNLNLDQLKDLHGPTCTTRPTGNTGG